MTDRRKRHKKVPEMEPPEEKPHPRIAWCDDCGCGHVRSLADIVEVEVGPEGTGEMVEYYCRECGAEIEDLRWLLREPEPLEDHPPTEENDE